MRDERNLEKMLELVRKVRGYCDELYGLRNRLIHAYQGVNLNLVWEIITEDLPNLEKQLEEII